MRMPMFGLILKSESASLSRMAPLVMFPKEGMTACVKEKRQVRARVARNVMFFMMRAEEVLERAVERAVGASCCCSCWCWWW